MAKMTGNNLSLPIRWLIDICMALIPFEVQAFNLVNISMDPSDFGLPTYSTEMMSLWIDCLLGDTTFWWPYRAKNTHIAMSAINSHMWIICKRSGKKRNDQNSSEILNDCVGMIGIFIIEYVNTHIVYVAYYMVQKLLFSDFNLEDIVTFSFDPWNW